MNNSSDSDNEDNIIEIKKIDAPKKRGRPRKNLFLEKPVKDQGKKEITNAEKDIILHLPVFIGKNKKKELDEIENKKETTNEISNSEDESEDDEAEIILSGSDDESSVNSESSNSDEEKDYKNLYKKQLEESKKKEKMIHRLRGELEGKRITNVFESEVQKDLKAHIINMKLIDNNTNKIIEIKKSDLNCWWDTYPINDYPYFLPEKYYNGKFYVFGCFSSPECAASYNLNLNDYKVMERFALLQKLYGPIKKLAAPKEVLKKYGGIVEIEEYRKNLITCDKEYRLKLPPMVLLNHIIDEITIEKNEKDYTTKNNIGTFSKKKLPMVKNNLFNTMGIKNK